MVLYGLRGIISGYKGFKRDSIYAFIGVDRENIWFYRVQ